MNGLPAYLALGSFVGVDWWKPGSGAIQQRSPWKLYYMLNLFWLFGYPPYLEDHPS